MAKNPTKEQRAGQKDSEYIPTSDDLMFKQAAEAAERLKKFEGPEWDPFKEYEAECANGSDSEETSAPRDKGADDSSGQAKHQGGQKTDCSKTFGTLNLPESVLRRIQLARITHLVASGENISLYRFVQDAMDKGIDSFGPKVAKAFRG